MITGYLVGEDNNNKVYDYCEYYYPEGNLDSNAAFVFNYEQIKEIFHLGYIDIESIQFHKAISKIVGENINQFVTHNIKHYDIPNLKQFITPIEKLKEQAQNGNTSGNVQK